MDAKNFVAIGALLLAMVITSCVKDPQDIPPGFSGDGVFGLTGNIDGESIGIEAGTENWTAQPTVVQRDSLEVYTSVLSVDGCLEECSPSWRFSF